MADPAPDLSITTSRHEITAFLTATRPAGPEEQSFVWARARRRRPVRETTPEQDHQSWPRQGLARRPFDGRPGHITGRSEYSPRAGRAPTTACIGQLEALPHPQPHLFALGPGNGRTHRSSHSTPGLNYAYLAKSNGAIWWRQLFREPAPGSRPGQPADPRRARRDEG